LRNSNRPSVSDGRNAPVASEGRLFENEEVSDMLWRNMENARFLIPASV
jgi:hypothetical protein